MLTIGIVLLIVGVVIRHDTLAKIGGILILLDILLSVLLLGAARNLLH